MNSHKHLLRNVKCNYINRFCHSVATEDVSKPKKKYKISHSRQLQQYFNTHRHLREIRPYIPAAYLRLKRGSPDFLYLICSKVAKTIASHLKAALDYESDQVIAETNAGLGLVTIELLEDGAKLVRMYESCQDFRQSLKDFGAVYPGRVELFTRNIFHLYRYAYIDRHDQGNRVAALLRNVPKRRWDDEPVMTVVGTMPKLSFLRYLVESVALQNDIVRYGRIQMFAIIRARDYGVLAAQPTDNLRAYQHATILYNLLFDYELLEKLPRKMFLPWEPPLRSNLLRCHPANLDPEKIYLVKINFKKELPVPPESLLALYYFIRQLYGKGTNRVIPTIEKWVPGCGMDIILPKLKHADYFENISIFTQFRELTPNQVLSVFKEMITNSGYAASPFIAMMENAALKVETIETNLADSIPMVQNSEENFEVDLTPENIDMK